jgi:hypothetical protein
MDWVGLGICFLGNRSFCSGVFKYELRGVCKEERKQE